MKPQLKSTILDGSRGLNYIVDITYFSGLCFGGGHALFSLGRHYFWGVAPVPAALEENRVNYNKKGCNKHFKDSLLLTQTVHLTL